VVTSATLRPDSFVISPRSRACAELTMPLGMRMRIMKCRGRRSSLEDTHPLEPLLVVVGDGPPALAREAEEILRRVEGRPSPP